MVLVDRVIVLSDSSWSRGETVVDADFVSGFAEIQIRGKAAGRNRHVSNDVHYKTKCQEASITVSIYNV